MYPADLSYKGPHQHSRQRASARTAGAPASASTTARGATARTGGTIKTANTKNQGF